MSKRKNYGAFVLIASLVLGVFLLTGSFIWMADKANMLLAVFVLILYGVGQWMTVVYWQNIQNDWESTGEVLGRLQQAVSDIPAALDSNLKAIAEKLSEGQQQALSKLQGEVSAGALKTLDNGATLIAQSLDKNLRAPLASLETAMGAWRDQSDVQSQAARVFGEELRKAQSEWTSKAQSLAEGLTSELKALAAAGARAGEQSQSVWAEQAATLQTKWEKQIHTMQESLVSAVAKESAKLGGTLSQGADALIAKVEGLQASQAGSHAKVLDQALAGLNSQSRTMNEATAAFAEGQARLIQELSKAQGQALGEAGKMLEAQGKMGLDMAGKVSGLADQMDRGTKDFQELAHLAQVNQVEMQAGVGMLNSGLATILERLEKQASAGDGYQNFLSELARALATFQERASEVLIENAMKTQEILMEVLGHTERKRSSEAMASEAVV